MSSMAHNTIFMFAFPLLLLVSTASCATIERTFEVGNLTVGRLCAKRVVTAVNDMLPGPTLKVREGDSIIAHVINKSPYNITIHWHGIYQLMTAWADGPAYVTQCPITPGNRYTYRFKVTGQEGTLWWHAHISFLRATVHGAIIIYPRHGRSSYPFPKPYKELPIVFGEWWNSNVVEVEEEFVAHGGGPNTSDAYTINGQPGDLYPCSRNKTSKLNVVQGKTYLLRIINAALNNQLFFRIQHHRFTVVAIDASYTQPYNTDLMVIAPGQTMDVLFTANQPIRDYYLAARPYSPTSNLDFNNSTTTAIIHYKGARQTPPPLLPSFPLFNDTKTAFTLHSNFTSLSSGPHWHPCPRHIDERLFITLSVNLMPCGPGPKCTSQVGPMFRFAASMNNVSFSFSDPKTLSLLQAYYSGVSGIYTEDFPVRPPTVFDYTNRTLNLDFGLILTEKATRVKRLKFNSTVEIVLQNTALIAIENHPMHLHGFDFYIVGQGFGNFDPVKDPKKYNLVNPQVRNTIAVPIGGWAVIRFRANNPGLWFMHCHLEAHMPWGLANAYIVENGPTASPLTPSRFAKLCISRAQACISRGMSGHTHPLARFLAI